VSGEYRGLALLCALVSAAGCLCGFPTARECAVELDDCPEGSYCDADRGYCVALADGQTPPSADAGSDAGVIELDAAGRDLVVGDLARLDVGGVDNAAADSAPSDLLVADVSGLELALLDSAATDSSPSESGALDAADADAAAPDSAGVDAALLDTSLPDALMADTLAPDALIPDALIPDTLTPDVNQPDTSLPDTSQPDACAPPSGPAWWDVDYGYRFPLDVEAAPSAYTIEVSLSGADAAALYDRSQVGGDDLRLVWHSGGATELDRELIAYSAGSVIIRFKIQGPGGFGGGASTYYIYVGNPSPGAPPADLHNVYLFFDDFDSTAVGQTPSGWRLDPAGSWSVVDDGGGDHVLRALGSGRLIAEIQGNSAEDIGIGASLRFDAQNGANNNGVYFRATQTQPTSSLYLWYAQLREANDQAQIGEYNIDKANSWSVGYTVNTATWYDIEARVVGSSMNMYVNGTSQVSQTIGESGAEIGLFAYDAEVVYDDVFVRLLASPEPAVSLGAEERPCS